MKPAFRPAVAILAALLLGGCASFHPVRVQPWERAKLADELMNPRRAPLDTAFAEHILLSREGSAGGAGVGGSGCGCN
jgi:hypothetical protein